jgi:hypothetical protein
MPKMLIVALGNWLRRLFSSGGPDDEAAEREEYGLPDRGEVGLERSKAGSFAAGGEAAEAAEDELDEFKAPRDPAP